MSGSWESEMEKKANRRKIVREFMVEKGIQGREIWKMIGTFIRDVKGESDSVERSVQFHFVRDDKKMDCLG